jgi:iron complex outermembrane recepter protein
MGRPSTAIGSGEPVCASHAGIGSRTQERTRKHQANTGEIMTISSRTHRLASASAAVLALWIVPASAQDVRSSAAAGAGSDIVVTARKREERALDVPIAITAVSGEALERRGANNLTAFLQEAPGVGVYDYGNGGTRITIRGISTSLGPNENGYYLDDLPFTGVTVPISPDVRAWDLDRVEVLRGPQGTLFGEGSMGGTVRILTRNADLDGWEAKGQAYASDTKGGGTNRGIKGAFNAPIVPGVLAVRVAGTAERLPGWIDDDLARTRTVNDQTYTTFRAKARFDPTDRLSINGSYWFYRGSFPAGASRATDDNQPTRTSSLATRTEYRLYGVSARYDFGGAEAFYGYSRNTFDVTQSGAAMGGTVTIPVGVEVDAHELRLASNGSGPLQWTLGGYLRDADREEATVFGHLGINNRDSTQSEARALFAEATYTLPSVPIDLTAGLRYFRERRTGTEASGPQVSTKPEATYKSWNPRVSVAWHPTANATVYASAAKGFRPGLLQPLAALSLARPFGIALPATLKQDSIWTYELGAKADLFDRLMTLEAAVYYSDWKNVAVRIPIGNTGFNGLVTSDGTETTGVELAASVRPTEGLTLAASGSYNDATYSGSVAGTGIVDGTPVDDIAKFTANASADYRAALSDTVTGFGRIGWQHNSRRSFRSFPLYRPGDVIDLVDARLGVEFERFTIAAFVDNLTNEQGALTFRQVALLAPGVTDTTSYRPRPRTVGLELTAHFGGDVR